MEGRVERIEYEVAWFPRESPDRTRVFTDVAKAEAFFADRAEEGSCPILFRREVITTDWQMIRNSVPTPGLEAQP